MMINSLSAMEVQKQRNAIRQLEKESEIHAAIHAQSLRWGAQGA